MTDEVVSFRISEELYNKLKESGKTVIEILEPLLIDFFNAKHIIHASIPKETEFSYDDIDKTVDAVLERFYGK